MADDPAKSEQNSSAGSREEPPTPVEKYLLKSGYSLDRIRPWLEKFHNENSSPILMGQLAQKMQEAFCREDAEAEKSPSNIVKTIQQKSARVAELATGVSNKLIAFEKWLNELPGRVEASFSIGGLGNEFRDIGLTISLRRSGKQWSIFYTYFEPGDDEQVEYKLLTEGDLDTKLLAIKHFPDLLKAILEAQERRMNELKAGNDEFDAFAASIGLKIEKEGK